MNMKLRTSQEQIFDRLCDAQYGILNGPTGWGKSLTLCALVADDQLETHRKAVIAIPQRIISKGFVKPFSLTLPSGRQVNWAVDTDLCGGRGDAKVSSLVDFLLNPSDERIIVTTHMTLGYAFQKLTPEQRATAFQDTTLVIDEAHHIQASDEGANQLGEAINHLLNLDEESFRLLLATAYFFRGDRLSILHDNHLNKFTKAHVPFDEYWSSLQHTKTYSYDFVAFKGTVFDDVDKLMAKSQEPTIVYCPPEGHKLLMGKTKQEFADKIIETAKQHYGATLWAPGTQDQSVIVDLVDIEHRADKVAWMMRHGDRAAVILTVGMFKEGADWPSASRVIDLVPTSSDQDRNQRFGRLIRDYPGKSHITYVSFFPHVTTQAKEDQRLYLTTLFAHFHASLLMANAVQPIKMPVQEVEGETEGTEEKTYVDYLGQLDAETQAAVVRECYEELIALSGKLGDEGKAVTADEARQVVLDVLTTRKLQHTEQLAKQILLLMRRQQNASLDTKDLVAAGFDKVWHSDILDGMVLFSAGVGGPSTFKEIRQVIASVFESRWQDHYARISQLPAPPPTTTSAYHWIQSNKAMYKSGDLTPDKVKSLEAISWWQWKDSFKDRWMRNHELMMKLPECPKAGTKEYAWVRQQRRMKDKLPDDKIELCEQISWWTWETEIGWAERCQILSVMPECPKSRTTEYEWVKYLRKRFTEGKIPDDLFQMCEQIPWWEWPS